MENIIIYVMILIGKVINAMNKDTIDIILIAVQMATLIALIFYVIKTWHIASAAKKSTEISEKILKEMKETRDQENAPYVITYFDATFAKALLFLVVKNLGKSIAKDVKLEFNPKLINSEGDRINNLPLLKNGISSIPPGHEVRTFFDHASFYYKKELPLRYASTVRYLGGMPLVPRTTTQILDLAAYKGLMSIKEEGIHELSLKVGKLVEILGELKEKI